MPVILITDNGSTRPNATLQLRKLADRLSTLSGEKIYPVSFQHAQRIPAEQLNDQKAQVFSDFMSQKLQQGETEFIVLPLFFGVSKAITSFIPEQMEILQAQFGHFSLDVAEVIYPLPDGDPLLEKIIYEHIMQTAENNKLPLDNIVLVDHGSPVQRVTEVRKSLANRVQQKLPRDVFLEQAVMERRPGEQYDFNGDLLKDWLIGKAKSGATAAIVVLQFFLAGRHAGKNGDIIEICDTVMNRYPQFKIAISPLIAEHPLMTEILHKRLQLLL